MKISHDFDSGSINVIDTADSNDIQVVGIPQCLSLLFFVLTCAL